MKNTREHHIYNWHAAEPTITQDKKMLTRSIFYFDVKLCQNVQMTLYTLI